MRVRNPPLILLILVLLSTALGLGQIVVAYSDYPFFFDEAIHANGGLSLAVDLWHGDFRGFLQTFYQQGFYPPTFSVPKAFAFYYLGATTTVARGFSLGCLILAQLVIYFFGRRLWVDLQPDQANKGGWIGLIAVLLTLTSLPLLNASTHVMLEAPGLLISFAFLWLYYRTFASSAINGTLARPANSDKRGFVLTSLMLMAVFLTKYTYGLAMIGTVGVMELSMLDWRSAVQLRQMGTSLVTALMTPMRAAANRWLWLIGPFVACLIIWLGTPYKLSEFFGYATAQPNEAQWSWEALFFYPRNIALQQLPSPLFGVITLIGLGWAIRRWDRPGMRLLLIYFAVGMLEMMLNFPKIPRFVVTFLPAVHLLTGLMLFSVFSGQHSIQKPVGKWAVGGLLILSLLWAAPVLYGRYSTINPLMSSQLRTAPALNEIPIWVDEQIPDSSRFYVVNYFDLLNPQSLAWGFVTNREGSLARFENYLMPGGLLVDPTTENVDRFRQDVLDSGAEFVMVIEGGDWGTAWPAYDRQLKDLVEFYAHKDFRVEVVNRPTDILWERMMDHSVADYVLEHDRGVLNLRILIYRVKK